MKRVIIESHIPEVPESLSEIFDVVRLAPEEITPEAVRDADALIVRTRTRCDATLLDGSKVSFVATATIGTDHIDIDYCRRTGRKVVSAPGCNAPAVAQYVMASILTMMRSRRYPDDSAPSDLTLGVVGVGHVGSIVARWGSQLGFNVLQCDPPRADAEGTEGFCSLDDIAANADIVTFHVPHTLSSCYPTHHIADRRFFESLKRQPGFINSARGPIADTPALIDAINRGLLKWTAIDCWEGEPNISLELLQIVDIATPHIAGYSHYGKIRATATVLNALCEHFGEGWRYVADVPQGGAAVVTPSEILASYNPLVDTEMLRNNPENFELLRNKYPLRREV